MPRDLVHLSGNEGIRQLGNRIPGNIKQRFRLGLSLCAAAGPKPEQLLDFGLSVLRAIPGARDHPLEEGESFWPLAGLLTWMTRAHPTEEDERNVWEDLKQLYPRTPHTWRRTLTEVTERLPDLELASGQLQAYGFLNTRN